jgi:hypothetical protein
MKYILTQTNQNQLGPFNSVTQNEEGWVADDAIYYTSVFGVMTSQEVADDYETPNQIAAYNAQQSQLREAAYKLTSDPINFQYQAGVKTEQEWLDARAAIQAQYPYKEQV